MNSRNCENCNDDVHRASYLKQLRSKKHLENKKQNELDVPEWLFKEPIENKIKLKNNPKSLKQIARDNIGLDGKQLKKELAKKMINPIYFTDRTLRVGFNLKLDCHHINHSNSKLTSNPSHREFDIETRYVNKILKEMSVTCARLINQYNFKYQTVFSARLDKQGDDNQVLDETELFISLNINFN